MDDEGDCSSKSETLIKNLIDPIVSAIEDSSDTYQTIASSTLSVTTDTDDDAILVHSCQSFTNGDAETISKSVIISRHNQENAQSQIKQGSIRRLSNSQHEKQTLHNKKVRFNQVSDAPLICDRLFVSQAFDDRTHLKAYDRFLSNLAIDLCLEQRMNDEVGLGEQEKRLLQKFNESFHPSTKYRCKYCSFQTDSRHVLDHHYRTPHTLPTSEYSLEKYRCTYCAFKSVTLNQIRLHTEKNHQIQMITDLRRRQLQCRNCPFESDHRRTFENHQLICKSDRNQLAFATTTNFMMFPKTQKKHLSKSTSSKAKNGKPIQKLLQATSVADERRSTTTEENSTIDAIIIESDHESLASSDDLNIIVSSDDESMSTDEHENRHQNGKTLNNGISLTNQLTVSNLSSLSKLLMLNGSSMSFLPKFPESMISQNRYQICTLCRCYIEKTDLIRHINEKHPKIQNPFRPKPVTTPSILNSGRNTGNTWISSLSSNLFPSKTVPEIGSSIFLFSMSMVEQNSITLNMIKCPWCNKNYEHIEVITGHMMQYHRMTLAAATVVVAEQMKLQITASSQLSVSFSEELKEIVKVFNDNYYWISLNPKVFLHRLFNVSCFECQLLTDDIENHLLTLHQLDLRRLNESDRCCLCGFHCDEQTQSLVEHQLRSHGGVVYSSVLNQFIRFEPAPTKSKLTVHENNTLLDHQSTCVPSTNDLLQRSLLPHTEQEYSCQKCSPKSTTLFTFEELINHLSSTHQYCIQLKKQCTFCKKFFVKGDEYNQHCLGHIREKRASIRIRHHQ